MEGARAARRSVLKKDSLHKHKKVGKHYRLTDRFGSLWWCSIASSRIELKENTCISSVLLDLLFEFAFLVSDMFSSFQNDFQFFILFHELSIRTSSTAATQRGRDPVQ